MKLRWAFLLPVLTILASSFAVCQAQSQGYAGAPGMVPGSVWSTQPPMMGGGYGPPPGGGPMMGGGMPPGYDPRMAAMQAQAMMPMQGGGMPMQGAMPMQGGMPMQGAMPMQGGMGMPPDAYGYGGYGPEGGGYGPEAGGECPGCGGMGCRMCRRGIHNGLLGDVLGIVGPYPDGGCAAVRWYDVSLDFMMLERDDAGTNRAIASDGVSGPIVLSTNQLDDFKQAPSFRVSAAFQVAPGASLEFTYFGLFSFNSYAQASSPSNNLYSVVSQFGTMPPFGFDETDESDFQSIQYKSTFDNYEANLRRRWMSPNSRYQGSWLIGARFFQLDEKFKYLTQSDVSNGLPAPRSEAEFNTDVNNALTGIQIGGDVWTCLLPGLRIGGEGKVGVYGNYMNVNNIIGSTSLANAGQPAFQDGKKSGGVAFIGQLEGMVTYRVSQQWTLKGGYQVLYVDGVALATENFNAVPPNVFAPPPGVNRVPFVNSSGSVFYNGYTVGAEFMW